MIAFKTALTLWILASIVLPSRAEEVFRAQLQPSPDADSAGSGYAVLELDDFETQIAFTVEIQGLSSPEIAAHIHYAGGSIAYTLPEGESKSGVWQDPGNLNVLLLREGTLYILVHTDHYPNGELRGDIGADVVSHQKRSWGETKRAFGPRPD